MVTMVSLQEKASSPRPSKHRQETGDRCLLCEPWLEQSAVCSLPMAKLDLDCSATTSTLVR
jgi:hypothetical protein